MYLAPLNYDRYFKKVFSDTGIARRFLEDFFDTRIDSIELLTTQHKLTDDAVAVEFDFRCRIGEQFVIIDMQQWYKPDIVHRFYTYHCINTALQLENMPLKSMYLEHKKERKLKDYSELMPVVTLIWMVDDVLNFRDDYVSYTMTPEIVTEFVGNNLLWQNQDMTELLKNREPALRQLGNKTKKLDFLRKNKLIYAFQKNIVRNKRYSKYYRWFELAEKTKNRLNEKSDFLEFAEDEIFAEIIRRISRETLKEEDYTYIDDYEKFIERVRRYDKGVFDDGREEGREKGREEGIKQTAANMLKAGMDAGMISQVTGLSTEEIAQLKITETQ
jgi:hypothetical protein